MVAGSPVRKRRVFLRFDWWIWSYSFPHPWRSGLNTKGNAFIFIFLPPQLLFISFEVMSVLLVDGNKLRDRAVGLIL